MKQVRRSKKIRFAVVGLGYISQAAMLPAFKHASNVELIAVVSSDPLKLKKIQKKYRIPYALSYNEYGQLLAGGEIDAVYIALPNSQHCEYALRAARAGIHVLCEKPLAVTAEECESMIEAAQENHVKLMTAYRLHFEEANLSAVKLVKSGTLGIPRIFNSIFTMQVKKGDIRLQKNLGGGTLYDIGIYCVNAARYLFQAEPYEVTAFSARRKGEKRFKEVDEMTSAIMKFPGDRLASFTSSFGASDTCRVHVVGTRGDLMMKNAFEYAEPIELEWTVNGKTKKKMFKVRDQFAPELIYFSKCILENKSPEPSGKEGLADVRIIQALYHSAQSGRPVSLDLEKVSPGPQWRQENSKPAVKKPELVHASSPHVVAA